MMLRYLLRCGSTTTTVVASLLLVAYLVVSDTAAYIISPSAVPVHRQVKWLKQMTVDICQAEPGQLSPSQLSQAPELMYAWSHVHQSPGGGDSSFLSLAHKKECALAVESLVKRVIDERRATAGSSSAAAIADLTVDDYNCLLESWARSGQGVAAAERCEQILLAMQEHGPQPDLSSFKTTLMSWRQVGATVRFAPYRTQRLLEWMIDLYSRGENVMALPDADCFDVVMQIWSRSGHKQAPEQTEHILGVMEKLYERVGLQKLKPRSSSFNAVLAAWAKSGRPQAADRAIAILSFMERLASSSDDNGAGDQVGEKNVAPDSASYNIVMGAFARSADTGAGARKADAILRHAVDAYVKDPSHFSLDTILFNTAMGAWSKSNKTGAYRKARAILDRQIALHQAGCRSCRPDIYGYTSVIASCASEPGDEIEREKAYNVAIQTYKEMKENDKRPNPNHVTYGTMLKAIAKLLPAGPSRNSIVQNIFVECCQAGCVGDMVVSRLREAAPPGLFRQLMQEHTKKSLPVEWTRNVNEMNDYRRKKTPSSRRKRAEV